MSNPNPPLLSIHLPLSSLARHTAQQFADEQVTLDKARRTFLNTLSVYAVRDYFALIDIETDLNQGDSWNPFMRHCEDVADLMLPGIGRLECRPVFGVARRCSVPPEVWWQRIAYIFVQIDPSYTEATLLGILFRVEQVEVLLDRLQTVDDLWAYLNRVQQNRAILEEEEYVLLRDWRNDFGGDDWLAMPELLAQMKSFAFRWRGEGFAANLLTDSSEDGVSRGQFIDLGLHSVPLTLWIEENPPNHFNLMVRVFPSQGSCLIPEGLTLTVVNADRKTVLEAQARQQDGILQLRFSGLIGEVFQVRLSLGDIWVTQTFMI